jgi:hypothetical protein
VSQSRTLLCGKGRLGQLIASALDAKNIAHAFARVDAMHGLVQNGAPVCGALDALVICLVPKHEEGRDGSRPSSGIHSIPGDRKSGWHGLLDGLLQQVQRKELSIQRVLFISSTSVYESIATGMVDAQTKVTGASVRSQGLLDAESVIPQLSAHTSILRLTGLVGPGYNKYDPVTFSNDKPRQAIDTRAVAREVAQWFAEQPAGHRIDVLTDGFVYWQGRKLDGVKDAEEIQQLGKTYRLLEPSVICRQY